MHPDPWVTLTANRGRYKKSLKSSTAIIAPQDTPCDWSAIFNQNSKLTVDIGPGFGHSIIAAAKAAPSFNFVAIEVYVPAVNQMISELQKHELTNVRIVMANARAVLDKMFLPSELDRVNIFFPDPWPKTRHKKRRLINESFCQLLSQRLSSGAILHLATDWRNYGAQMRLVITRSRQFNLLDRSRDLRPITVYETKAKKAQRHVYDLRYVRR